MKSDSLPLPAVNASAQHVGFGIIIVSAGARLGSIGLGISQAGSLAKQPDQPVPRHRPMATYCRRHRAWGYLRCHPKRERWVGNFLKITDTVIFDDIRHIIYSSDVFLNTAARILKQTFYSLGSRNRNLKPKASKLQFLEVRSKMREDDEERFTAVAGSECICPTCGVWYHNSLCWGTTGINRPGNIPGRFTGQTAKTRHSVPVCRVVPGRLTKPHLETHIMLYVIDTRDLSS